MYEFEENPIAGEDNYDDHDGGSDQENDNDNKLPELPTKPDADGIKVEPKKIVFRNPRVTLNAAKLKGDRGLHTIEDYFKDVQYKGKGHEREDLNVIMSKLEHWGHRMFPDMRFADFVNRVEQLTKKGDVQNHWRRYRTGTLMPLLQDRADIPDEEIPERQIEDDPVDDFDALLSEQVDMHRNISKRTENTDNTMDFTFREVQGMDSSLGVAEIPPTPPRAPISLSEDVKAKIAENRRLALERLRAKQNSQAVESTPRDEDFQVIDDL
ncbi:Protein TIPIN homolog [Sergentomyia squamirostris]